MVQDNSGVFLTPNEAADRLGVTRKTIYRMLRAGRLARVVPANWGASKRPRILIEESSVHVREVAA